MVAIEQNIETCMKEKGLEPWILARAPIRANFTLSKKA
jgi:hypothetical protein